VISPFREKERETATMIVEKIVNTTYGVLEQVLFELGFQASYGTNEFNLPHIVYKNEEWDAVISLPARPKDELMYGGHFIVAEKTVEGRGVTDAETFYRLLRDEAQKEAQVAWIGMAI
jgi:hypothetical protein